MQTQAELDLYMLSMFQERTRPRMPRPDSQRLAEGSLRDTIEHFSIPNHKTCPELRHPNRSPHCRHGGCVKLNLCALSLHMRGCVKEARGHELCTAAPRVAMY
eukprot:4664529-Amphidinium_carterae.1